jgi:hypothetical protein
LRLKDTPPLFLEKTTQHNMAPLFVIIPNADSHGCVDWEEVQYCNDVSVAKRLLINHTLYRIKYALRRDVSLASQAASYKGNGERIAEYGLGATEASGVYEYVRSYRVGNLALLLNVWRESIGCTEAYAVRAAMADPDCWIAQAVNVYEGV